MPPLGGLLCPWTVLGPEAGVSVNATVTARAMSEEEMFCSRRHLLLPFRDQKQGVAVAMRCYSEDLLGQ